MLKKHLIDQGYCFIQDKTQMDVAIIHNFLSTQSTWAINIPLNIVEKSIQNSMCFAILHRDELVAFARVITDMATFANLVDVFVLNKYRGIGLSAWLTEEILKHPELQKIRRFTLTTSTANKLYAKFGFQPVEGSKIFMQLYQPDVYTWLN